MGDEWVLPNRLFFTKWFYQNFHPSMYEAPTNGPGFHPDQSQQLIRDFIHTDSPYRGVLVYHGLGTGKSCASILATDSFVKNRKKVVVLLPASLENNYRKELNKCSSTGTLLRKKWSLVQLQIKNDMEEIELLKKTLGIKKDFIVQQKGRVWLPYVPKEFPEAKVQRKNVLLKSLSEEDQKQAQETYNYLINSRYRFLHYNGLTNRKLDELEKKDDFGEDAFDNAFVVIDEVHTFISRVVNGGKIAKRLYNMLISKPNIRLVLLSGTPVINHPFELCYTLNLLRGPMTKYSLSPLKDSYFPELFEMIDVLQNAGLYQHVDSMELDSYRKNLTLTLLPKGFVRKDRDSLELVKGPMFFEEGKLVGKMVNALKEKFPVHARVKTGEFTAFPDKKETFFQFFMDMDDPLNPRIKEENLALFTRRIQGIVSYYRIAEEEMFPKALPPIYKNIQMSSPQFRYYAEVRNEEIKKDDIRKKKEAKRKGKEDMFQTNSSYRAYSRMACNFVFPEEIKRPFPKDIRAKLLRKEIDIQEEDVAGEGEREEKKEAKTEVTEDKLYEQELKEALNSLEKQAAVYLQGKGLYDCSPKMYSLLQDLSTHPAPVKSLLYSQFRTVEGLRIFRMVLNQAGWKEIDFKPKGDGDWMIVNAEEVLDPKYHQKRYLVFGDKEKTDMLINLFNADMKFLPKTIQEQLATAKLTENLRGKLASLLMITQSGAEGLNLRNVRFVYILEPFWNQVRIDQVVGRAIRKRSHLELPEEERDVQVVLYQAVFSKKQTELNKTIKLRDEGKTTDENIFRLAQQKDKMIQMFLTALKSNAIDCIFHASKNKPLLNNYKCYIPPMNLDGMGMAFVPNIEDDKNLQGFGTKEKVTKVRGRAIQKKAVKYVILDDEKQLYDYPAYKDAGVLVEAIEQ